MTDVFISYSRSDGDFVRRLHELLSEAGKTTWVDWEGIPPTADWMAEIYAAIEGSNAFVVVLSPDAVSSDVCRSEIEHAVAHNKRLVPIEFRKVRAQDVPEPAATVNWVVFAEDGSGYEASFAKLLEALDTDLAWVSAHTHWLGRARDWEGKDRPPSLLLRGSDLREAEDWLADQGQDREPEPTALQREYVLTSRRKSSARQRRTIGAVALGMVVSIALAVLAVIERNEADRQRNEADRQRKVAEARALIAGATATAGSDPRLSLRLAREAVLTSNSQGSLSALREALARVGGTISLTGHDGELGSAVFSRNGKQVLTLSPEDRTFRVWDAVSGEEVTMVDQKGISSNRAVLSSEGIVVTADNDGSVRTWDPDSGQVRDTLRPSVGSISIPSRRCSPSGECEEPPREDSDSDLVIEAVTAVEISRDEELLLAAHNNGVTRVWKASDPEEAPQEFIAQGGVVLDATFSEDGRFVASGDDDGMVRIWEVESGEQRDVLQTGQGVVWGVDFSPDGALIASAGSDGSAKLWEVESGREVGALEGHAQAVWDVNFSPDGERIVTASADGTAKLWERAGEEVSTLSGHVGAIRTAEFNPDGNLVVTAGHDATARIWNLEGQVPLKLDAGGDAAGEAAFDPTATRVATASSDGAVRVFDLEGGGREVTTIDVASEANEPVDQMIGVAFSPDGDRLVAGGTPAMAAVFDAESGELDLRLDEFSRPIISVEFSPDGDRVLGMSAQHATAPIWDATTGELQREFYTDPGGIRLPVGTDAAFSPDGELVATADEEAVRIYDANDGAVVADIPGFDGYARSVEFSPDGSRLLAAGDDGTARAWEVETGEEVRVFRGHRGEVLDASYHPDGTLVLTAGRDGTARFWDAQTGGQLQELERASGALSSAAFSPDGLWIVTAGEGGSVLVSPCGAACLDEGDLLPLAKELAGELSEAERREYLY